LRKRTPEETSQASQPNVTWIEPPEPSEEDQRERAQKRAQRARERAEAEAKAQSEENVP
jgi:hypothetical protein